MPNFERGTTVRVPFPYADRDMRQRRPALVVSNGPIEPDHTLLWVAMITSAANRRWDSDVPLIEEHAAYGLPVPSLIRTAKLATIDVSAAEPLGSIGAARWAEVIASLDMHLGR